ncbi:MAG: hypothetical protein FWC50_08870 [Planctomycetaceae bacterium]|nr:hypothetical protein [Planctomycetaceae bacterium]
MSKENSVKPEVQPGKKILNASFSMGPINPGIKKPSTPKPATDSLKPGASGNNNKLHDTKNMEQNSNAVKK